MLFGTWERSPTIAIFALIVGVCLYWVYNMSHEDRVEMCRANAETVTILKTVVQDCTKSHQELTDELRTHKESMRRFATERSQ